MMTCPLISMKRFTILLDFFANDPRNSFHANSITGYFVIFNTIIRYFFNIMRFTIVSVVPIKVRIPKTTGAVSFP